MPDHTIAPTAGHLAWLGHATVLVRLGETRVLTDPVLRARVAHLRRHCEPPALHDGRLDAVLLSHLHRDHADGPSLRRLPGETPVLVPEGAARTVRRLGARIVREVRTGDAVEIGPGVTARAVPAVHDGRRAPFGRPAQAIGWLVEGDRRVYFAGDTEVFDGMRDIASGIDVALLPVWGWGTTLGPGHMGPAEAARATALLRPRTAVPIHWGTFLPVGMARRHPALLTAPGRDFAELAATVAPRTAVVVLRPGDVLDLDDASRRRRPPRRR
jgi:L-ascorbate metabolism protein UlaG (beta-lactamase superfamily)